MTIQPPPIRESFFSSPSLISQVWTKWLISVFKRGSDSEAFEAGVYKYMDTLGDDETFDLPTITNSAWGQVVVGDDEERAKFSIKSDGTVNLIVCSTNIKANATDDAFFLIGTSVANPLTIKNRLGASKFVLLTLWYG